MTDTSGSNGEGPPISHLVFEGNEEGVRARIRWHSTKFAMKQMLGEARRLRRELEEIVPLLPGHH